MLPILQIFEVSRLFGSHVGVAKTSLTVEESEVVLLRGPNGSGKTTLLRIAAGLLRPSSGSVLVMGKDPRTDVEVRQKIGFMGHELGLYDELTAGENLRFFADLYDLDNPSARIGDALDAVKLTPHRSRSVREYSRGMKERLALARLVILRPKLLLMDEPTTGLDTDSVRNLIVQLKRWRDTGSGIVVSTHDDRLSTGLEARVVTLS